MGKSCYRKLHWFDSLLYNCVRAEVEEVGESTSRMRRPLGIALMANETSDTNTVFRYLQESQGLVGWFRRCPEFLIIHLNLDALLITTSMLVTDSCWPKVTYSLFPT